eukprot:5430754-Amphidinium_carterae.1
MVARHIAGDVVVLLGSKDRCFGPASILDTKIDQLGKKLEQRYLRPCYFDVTCGEGANMTEAAPPDVALALMCTWPRGFSKLQEIMCHSKPQIPTERTQ